MTGVRAKTQDGGAVEIAAKLVVGADGRHSTIRSAAGFAVENLGAPMDVLWMRIAKQPGDPVQPLGNDRSRSHARHARSGRLLAVRATSFRKGAFDALKRGRYRRAARTRSPSSSRRCATESRELDDWSKVSMLEVRRRPAGTLASPRRALHRRRGARDVADRRRRHQPRHPGRRRNGEPARRTAARGRRRRCRPRSACKTGGCSRPR